jgi:hypothetical protein
MSRAGSGSGRGDRSGKQKTSKTAKISRFQHQGVEEEKCGSAEPSAAACDVQGVKGVAPMCWLLVIAFLSPRDASMLLNGVHKTIGLPKTAKNFTAKRLYRDLWGKPLPAGASLLNIYESYYRVNPEDSKALTRRKQLLWFVRASDKNKFFRIEPPVQQSELIYTRDLVLASGSRTLIDLIVELQPQWLTDIYNAFILPDYRSSTCPGLHYYDRRGPLDLRLIHWAAILNQVDDLRTLMRKKPSSLNDNGNLLGTPLVLAARYGHNAAVDALLKNPEVDVNLGVHCSPCYFAVRHGHLEVVRELLSSEHFVESFVGDKRISLLIAAIANHDLLMVKLLVNSGKVDVNHRMTNGQTAFSIAEMFKDRAIISELEKYRVATAASAKVPADSCLLM